MLGTLDTATLTDIANAIRSQAGVSRLYLPGEMAAAVAALDGHDAGGYVPQGYKQLASGVISDSVLSDIADAIRAQNGLSVSYRPSEMAQAILDLTWGTPAHRALLLADGTMEFCYRARATSALGTVAYDWEWDPAGYSAAADLPWLGRRQQVRRVVFSADLAGSGVTGAGYLCYGMDQCVEAFGIENLAGVGSVTRLFSDCRSLESIWAPAGTSLGGVSGSYPFYGCYALVGGDLATPGDNTAASALKLGAGGVLTDPAADRRVWAWGHLYADGQLAIGTGATPDPGRTASFSGRLCANAGYKTVSSIPWYGRRDAVTSAVFDPSLAAVRGLRLDWWLYWSRNLTCVSGWENLGAPVSLKRTLGSCSGLVELDLTGLDPSALESVDYFLYDCSSLVTIWGVAGFALPSACSKSSTFYGDTRLVGGAGTAFAWSHDGGSYLRVDTASTPGYMTARA